MLILPRWWPMNQTSETEMVCPSCLILAGQHEGAVAVLSLYSLRHAWLGFGFGLGLGLG